MIVDFVVVIQTAGYLRDMGVLGVDYDDPSIESIVQPDEKTTREELFKKLMAE